VKLDNSERFVSIGLPVFNGEAFISEAIESLLAQTHSNFELIVSDNASTDKTIDIVEGYARNDSRVRLIRQVENKGATDNYLFTLSEARAELFMWASHDDIWDYQWIEKLVKEIKPSDIGVRGEIKLFNESGLLRTKKLPNFKENSLVKYFLSDESEYKVHYIYALFYTEKLRKSNLKALENTYCLDCFFVYTFLSLGDLRSISGTHIMYRVHPGNLGKKYSARWKGWKKILYRIHPLSYYLSYIAYTKNPVDRFLIAILIPLKHFYAQVYFWFRGARELLLRKKFY